MLAEAWLRIGSNEPHQHANVCLPAKPDTRFSAIWAG